MLKPAKMSEVSILGMQKETGAILKELHEAGVVHLKDLSAEIKGGALKHLSAGLPLKRGKEASSLLLRIKWVLDVFAENREGGKKSIAERLKPPEDRGKPDIISFQLLRKECIMHLKSVEKELKKLERKRKRAEEKEKELKALRSVISEIRFNMDLRYMKDNGETYTLLGRVLNIDVQELGKLGSRLGGSLLLIGKEISRGRYLVLLQTTKENREIVDAAIRRTTFDRIRIPDLKGTPRSILKEIERKLKALEKTKSECRKRTNLLSGKHEKQLRRLYTLLSVFHERYENARKFARTEETFLVRGYVPEKYLPRLGRIAGRRNIVIEKNQPEDPPTFLDNNPFMKPFELVTSMFGYPKYRDVDPTAFIAFFFPMFFGWMLGDIAYGALLLMFSLWLLRTWGRVSRTFHDGSIILMHSAIWSIAFGVLFGSFFGSLLGLKPLWAEPFRGSLLILKAALVVGLVHINLGIFAGIYQNISSGKIRNLVFNNISLLLLQAGAALFLLGKNQAGIL